MNYFAIYENVEAKGCCLFINQNINNSHSSQICCENRLSEYFFLSISIFVDIIVLYQNIKSTYQSKPFIEH
jgi:hypothetical protein